MLEKRERTQIFISYAREDWDIVQRLYSDLKKAGFKLWINEKNLLAGQHWKSTVKREIEASEVCLLLYSSKSVSKRSSFQKEIKWSIDVLDQIPQGEIFIIPIRLDNCKIVDEKINDLQGVDLFLSYEDGLGKIIRSIEKILTKEKTIPPEIMKTSFEETIETCFPEGNPFSIDDADHENDKFLLSYFVQFPTFNDFLSDNSLILFAPRGGGKTACRKIVTYCCENQAIIPKKIFCTVYNNFDRVKKVRSNPEWISSSNHVGEIIRLSFDYVFNYFLKNPRQIIGKNSLKHLKLLKEFLTIHPFYLENDYLNTILVETGTDVKTIKSEKKSVFKDFLANKVEKFHMPLVKFIREISKKPSNRRSPLSDFSSKKLLCNFFELVQATGFDKWFILIDNVDGTNEMKNNMDACWKVIENLLIDPELIKANPDNIFFKFFLPYSMKEIVEERVTALKDKTIRPEYIKWNNPEERSKVLENRLFTFSKGMRTKLGSLYETGSDDLDKIIVRESQTPREIIEYGKKVFQACIRHTPEKAYITTLAASKVFPELAATEKIN